MQLSLRPYVTTGVPIVGASVLVAAPITPTPTDIQIPNPAVQVDRAVQLTAAASRPIEDAVNALIFAGANVAVSLAQLPAPLVAQLLGLPNDEAAELFLALGTLGLLGPLIGGAGGLGHAIQDLVDSEDLQDFLINTLDVVGLPIDGAVNGGFGPNLAPLIFGTDAIETLTGGLITPGPLPGTAPGTIPTLEGLITLLFGLVGGGDMMLARGSEGITAQAVPFNPPGLDNLPDDLQGAAEVLAGVLRTTLATAEALVRTALQNPRALPATIGAVGSGLPGTAQLAAAHIIADLIYDLPAPIGSSKPFPQPPDGLVAGGANALGNVITEVREVLAPGSTGHALKSQNLGTTGDVVKVPKTPRRPFINLDLHKQVESDGVKAGREEAGAVGTDTGTVKTFPRHRLGDGKTPVRDLVKKVLGGGDNEENDDDNNEADAS